MARQLSGPPLGNDVPTAATLAATPVARECERSAERQLAELTKANDVLRGTVATLASGPGIDAFLASIAREGAAAVDAATSVVFLYDPAAHAFRLASGSADGDVIASRLVQPSIGRPSTIPADVTAMWATLLASASPLFVHDVADERYTWPRARRAHRARGHRTIGYLRLQVGERPLGFLGLAWRVRDPVLAPERVTLLIALGQQLALALELDRLSELARAEAAQAAVLEERTRLAREVHDTLAQGLSGVVMQLARVRAKLGAGAAPADCELAVVERLARDSLAEVRRSLVMLRPPLLDADGLLPPLRAAVATGNASGPEPAPHVTLELLGGPRRVAPEVELELLRIAQAALDNARQHAHARNIRVELAFEEGGAIRLSIADDGRGFDAATRPTGRFGLIGMSERAARIGATLALVTAPNEGTEIVARWEPSHEAR